MSEESRIETMLRNILGETEELPAPVSRIEKMLANMCGGTYEIDPPVSRIEHYLKEILENGSGGGGSEVLDGLIDNTYDGILTTNASAIRQYALYYSAITGISAPKAVTVGQYAFAYCTNMTTVSLPIAETIANYAFQYCTKIQQIELDAVRSIGMYAFSECRQMHTLILNGALTSMGYLSYSGCRALSTIVLRPARVVSLSANDLSSTPFASGGTGGTLYVPAAQIDAYKAASNWTTVLGYENNSIAAIEGSPYER